jgi:KDO2-lipid IV(A) lauroyltransferase
VDVNTVPHRNFVTFERDHLRVHNAELLRVLDTPGPIVVVSAHTGNAELVCRALTHRGRPFVALVESIEPPEFADYLLRLRSGPDARFYEATFGGVRACLEALRHGGLLAVMADRDIQGSGMPVELFGRCVRLPRGPWEIARRSGAVVIPILSSRIDADHFEVHVNEPFTVARSDDAEQDVRKAIERWAEVLEEHLPRDPGQWTVLENFWERHRCG